MKVNIDLTKSNSDNDISDEILTDVGSGAFNLEHDFFYGSTDLEIWTGAGQTGTQLTETTDYTLGGINSDLTTRAGVNIYSTVTVTNVTYQTGDLYFTYHACADFIDAFDRYSIVRKYTGTGTGEEILIESIVDNASGTGGNIIIRSTEVNGTGGDIRILSPNGGEINLYDPGQIFIYSGSNHDLRLSAQNGNLYLEGLDPNGKVYTKITENTAADSVKIESQAGGIDIDSAAGLTIDDDSGSYITINSTGQMNIGSAAGQSLEIYCQGTSLAAFGLYSEGGTEIINYYSAGSGTGNPLRIQTENATAGGTGGNIILSTVSSAGSAGKITIDSAAPATETDAIKVNTTGGIDIDAVRGITINNTSASYNIVVTSNREGGDAIRLVSNGSSSSGIAINAQGTGSYINITAQGSTTSQVYVSAVNSTAADSIRLISFAGGISIEAGDSSGPGGITIQTTNDDTGTGNDLIIETDNDSTGTGGDVVLRTTDSGSGTPGNVEINAGGYTSLLGDVRLPGSAPASPAAGSVYFNAGTDTLYIHNGTGWVSTVLTT